MGARLRSNVLRNRLVSDGPKVFRGEAETHAGVGVGLASFSIASVPRNLRTSELSLKNLGVTYPATIFPEEPNLLTVQSCFLPNSIFLSSSLPSSSAAPEKTGEMGSLFRRLGVRFAPVGLIV